MQKDRGKWLKNKEDRGILKRGRIFYIRYRDQHGRMHVERVGPSKALARKVYAQRKTQVCERRFFPASGVLFKEILEDAIRSARSSFELKYPDRNFKTHNNYAIVKGWFEGRKADSITPSEIAVRLAEHTQCAATYNRFRVAISHAYKLAVQNRKVRENPGQLVKLQRENNARVRFLKPDEESTLRAAIRQHCPGKEPEVDLAIHTGMRWSEQYNLTWQAVDFDHGTITIVNAKGSGKDEHVPINTEARRALLKLRTLAAGHGLVCPANNYDHHRDWWLAALKTAAIEEFTWHSLRHTFASRLVANGVDLYTVSKLMRHKTIQTTARYSHLSDKHLADAVEKTGPKPSVTPGVTAPRAAEPIGPYVN